MIRDANLRFSDGTSGSSPFASVTPGALTAPVLFTDTPSLDLSVVRDLGRGGRLIARFDITTTFAGAAANTAAFVVGVADSESMLVNYQSIARATAYTTANLVAGRFIELPIPALDSLSSLEPVGGYGRRWLSLGAEVYVPASDWTDGGVQAHIQLDTSRSSDWDHRAAENFGGFEVQ